MNSELRPLWSRLFRFNWMFGLILILSICVPRFVLVLNANQTANYGAIGLIMLASAILPFLFLSRHGRRKIGIRKPTNYRWIGYSLVIGVLLSAALFALGYALYGDTFNNWYVYIGKSYGIAEGLSAQDKLVYFLIYAVSGMTFSPIGEELFFRGIVHGSFAKDIGEHRASVVDSLAFALTHLAHFGIVYISGAWQFLPVPAMLWVLGMFVTSIAFFRCKQRTGSIIGAIVSHAGFNLAMIYVIFYHL